MDGHEDEAVTAIIEARPNAKLNPAILRQQIDVLKGFVSTPATKDKPMGIMAEVDWRQGLDVLADGSLVPAGQTAPDFFTNDLLDTALSARVASGK